MDRAKWERLYTEREPEDLQWFAPEPPPELVRLLRDAEIPSGAALDLGCGPGATTSHLASRFAPAVGLDIAFGAVVRARSLAAERKASPLFLVAKAPALPFRDGSFSFVFDRGCMHSLRRREYAPHLLEVSRVLKPGGVFELFFSSPRHRPRGPLSPKGAHELVGRLLRRGKPKRLSRSMIRRLLPESMEPKLVETVTFTGPLTGGPRLVTHAVFRRR